jgi:uncharacterized protein with NRDE domain
MCLILVAWQAHPDFPLVLAANRDEFFARPAAPARWWADQPDILAGRDLEAGGTWLGVHRRGAFAGLTNFRDPASQRPGTPSRGALVADTLTGHQPVAERLAWLARHGGDYNGFNLIFSDDDELAVYESVSPPLGRPEEGSLPLGGKARSAKGAPMSGRGQVLGPGVYGLSNHLLDSPWPKVLAAKSRLHSALDSLPDTTPLLELLRDDRPAPDAALPRTGVSLEWERLLSSAFIRAPGYGTRCSTVILRDGAGHTSFREWTWNAAGEEVGQTTREFDQTG